jgi:hypothetical protein
MEIRVMQPRSTSARSRTFQIGRPLFSGWRERAQRVQTEPERAMHTVVYSKIGGTLTQIFPRPWKCGAAQ